MQAIQTKFIPASNTRGSRIKAWCEAGSLTIGYPHEHNEENAHLEAANALKVKLGWTAPFYGDLVQSCLPDNKGYAHTMVKPCPTVAALGNLVAWAVGCKGDKSINPYSVPEVISALKVLQSINGAKDWMDAADSYKS